MHREALPVLHGRRGSGLRGPLLLPLRCGQPPDAGLRQGPVGGGPAVLAAAVEEAEEEAPREDRGDGEMPLPEELQRLWGFPERRDDRVHGWVRARGEDRAAELLRWRELVRG